MHKALISIFLFGFTTFSSAQELNFPHIITSGYGEVSVSPNLASFNVQVEQTNLNAEQAKSSVDKIVEEFVAKLVTLGALAEHIDSSNLFVSPQYFYPKNAQPELIGYKAVRRVAVDVTDIAKLNQYLDVALESGVTNVNNIELKVKDRHRYQQMATQSAIENAQHNAQVLAEGFHRKLGEVWKIQYQAKSVAAPRVLKTMSLEQAEVFKHYQDTDIVIRDNVDVIYKLN